LVWPGCPGILAWWGWPCLAGLAASPPPPPQQIKKKKKKQKIEKQITSGRPPVINKLAPDGRTDEKKTEKIKVCLKR